MNEDLKFMQEALREAEQAFARGEVPVGCVIVRNGEIIGRGHNRREELNDPTAHAEIIAIREAAHHLQNWRLADCTLYVTLEPCPMCAGAIVLARIPRLVYGASDPAMGAVSSLYQLLEDARLNHRVEIIKAGVAEEECRQLLQRFFATQRD